MHLCSCFKNAIQDSISEEWNLLSGVWATKPLNPALAGMVWYKSISLGVCVPYLPPLVWGAVVLLSVLQKGFRILSNKQICIVCAFLCIVGLGPESRLLNEQLGDTHLVNWVSRTTDKAEQTSTNLSGKVLLQFTLSQPLQSQVIVFIFGNRWNLRAHPG